MSGYEFNLDDSDDSRRILIYFLLDVSGSMDGPPIQAVYDGLEFLVRNLRNTPEAVELAHLCLITFGSSAHVQVPLTPLLQVRIEPDLLSIAGSTNMTSALELVKQEIDKDFRENKGGAVKGDYKPLIFLMTDGAPDNLQSTIKASKALQNRPSGRTIGTFLALGCGQGANEANLKQIAPRVALMHDMKRENIIEFFKWVSASIAVASKAASRSTADNAAVEAPPVPKNSDGDSAFTFTF